MRNEITALDLQKQGNVVRLEKLSAEKIQLEEERTRLEARLAGVCGQRRGGEAQCADAARHGRRAAEAAARNPGGAEPRGARSRTRLLQQQAEKRSRLNVLEQLQAGHEGFSAGALAALKQSQHVLGSLADKIRVPDQYVTAIETALGHHLQLVLTEQPESAQPDSGRPEREQEGPGQHCAAGLHAATASGRSWRCEPAIERHPAPSAARASS